MSIAATLALTYSLYGIGSAIILIAFFLSLKKKYHFFWIFGLAFITIGALLIAMNEQMLAATAEWLLHQSSEADKAEAQEAILHTKIWSYVISAPLLGLGVNLISEFLARSDPQ